jgi:hypothetical protein
MAAQASLPHSSSHKASNPSASHPKFGRLPLSTSGPQDCALTGSALLNTPYFNKGAGFPPEERKQFKLTGLLPQHVSTLEQQVKRAYQQYSSRSDDLDKNTFMTSLGEQNQVLYFRVSGCAFMLFEEEKGGWRSVDGLFSWRLKAFTPDKHVEITCYLERCCEALSSVFRRISISYIHGLIIKYLWISLTPFVI